MTRRRLCALGVVLTALAVGGCKSDPTDGSASAAVDSCNGYCVARLAKNCADPLYASVDECKAAECAALGKAPANCRGPLETYYACEASQADICADDGCIPQFGALVGCAPGAGGGNGGASGADGGAATSDAGTGTGAPGTPTPAALGTRLVLWLDAGKGLPSSNGQPVSGWQDQSRARNDATQPKAGNQPIFMAVGINGRPSVTFDGSATFVQIADAPSLRWGTGDFTLLVVARGANNTTRARCSIRRRTSRHPGPDPRST